MALQALKSSGEKLRNEYMEVRTSRIIVESGGNLDSKHMVKAPSVFVIRYSVRYH